MHEVSNDAGLSGQSKAIPCRNDCIAIHCYHAPIGETYAFGSSRQFRYKRGIIASQTIGSGHHPDFL